MEETADPMPPVRDLLETLETMPGFLDAAFGGLSSAEAASAGLLPALAGTRWPELAPEATLPGSPAASRGR